MTCHVIIHSFSTRTVGFCPAEAVRYIIAKWPVTCMTFAPYRRYISMVWWPIRSMRQYIINLGSWPTKLDWARSLPDSVTSRPTIERLAGDVTPFWISVSRGMYECWGCGRLYHDDWRGLVSHDIRSFHHVNISIRMSMWLKGHYDGSIVIPRLILIGGFWKVTDGTAHDGSSNMVGHYKWPHFGVGPIAYYSSVHTVNKLKSA